jgi:hypothetical protein
VRRWLVLLVVLSLVTIVASVTNLILSAMRGTLLQTAVPLTFSIITGVQGAHCDATC